MNYNNTNLGNIIQWSLEFQSWYNFYSSLYDPASYNSNSRNYAVDFTSDNFNFNIMSSSHSHRSHRSNDTRSNFSHSSDYSGSSSDHSERDYRRSKRHYKSGSRVRKYKKHAPEPIEIIPNFFDIYRESQCHSVYFQDINPYSHEFASIAQLITNECFVIDSLQSIHNPYLEQSYALKREEKRWMYPELEEKLLFHGTRWTNIQSICEYNFDWRMTGCNRGHKYGQGVNFSTNATYASNYCDLNTSRKVMIVAKVLIGKSCQGYEDTVLPPKGYDTTQKEGGIVIVKYEDSEFYPAYKLTYHFENPFRRKFYNKYYKDCYYF